MDPTAGFGDRLLAALASPTVTKYIGIDSNLRLKNCYKAMVNHHKKQVCKSIVYKAHPKGNFYVYSVPAETFNYKRFSKQYDVIFTCPPYYTKERYPCMPSYNSHTHWEQTFITPVFTQAYTHLNQAGYVALVL